MRKSRSECENLAGEKLLSVSFGGARQIVGAPVPGCDSVMRAARGRQRVRSGVSRMLTSSRH